MGPSATSVFVPSHVTGFFSVHRTSEPVSTGSRGAGLTLTDGVTVSVAPTDDPALTLNGEVADIAPVELVVAELGQDARIDIETSVPMGAGFGVSGAAALGTAVGMNRVFACASSENELVRIAHVAEVEAGTGLGDVVAQHRGGAPIRLEPGAPGHGELDGIPDARPIEYVTFGALSTEAVISGEFDRINRAGSTALEAVRQTPTLERFLAASRRFSKESGLETDRVRDVIDDVEAAGGGAAMAMLGRTVFAIDGGLSDAGYAPSRCDIASGGISFE